MTAKARRRQTRRQTLGKKISEFGERLAVSPLERIESTIVGGFDEIIRLLDADRICWYEVEETSGALMHKYTATARQTPLSPKIIPAGKMPYLAQRLMNHKVAALENLDDLPAHGREDRLFLEKLGVKSLLLISSSYSERRKGVLGVSSYSVKVSWPEETINQLAVAANIIGATLERKDAQAATLESERRFRSLFGQASIGIALETMDGRIIEVNPAFCAMLGYSQEELRASSCANISHPEDEKIERVLFEELRLGMRASYRIEKRFFRKDGSQIWGQVSVSLLNTHSESAPLVIGMISDVTAQKMAEASLHQRDRELQQLAGRLIEAQEEERSRISRELHDDIGQRVSLLTNEVEMAGRLKPAAQQQRAATIFPNLHKELSAIATDIHELSHELHSSRLEYCGLKVALTDLCTKYSNNHNLDIELQTESVDANLPPDISLCLFRVAQEALTNVLKHGETKRVLVNVVSDADRVRLTVKDFGVGFASSNQSEGIGIISMRERLRLCGGMLSVKSAVNKGTEVAAEIALAKKMVASARD
jgi:PAS domain S-box-containing protein